MFDSKIELSAKEKPAATFSACEDPYNLMLWSGVEWYLLQLIKKSPA